MQKVCLFALFLVLKFSLSAGTIAHFRLPIGQIDVELFDEQKPVTVRNFIRYVESGAYTNMIIHRWDPTFVIQGGGFWITNRNTTNATFKSVATFGTITNEYNVGTHYSNLYGTIAMAKVSGNPDSASSQWFFNLANNSTNLDNQNGGFTVFGRVIGGTNILNRFKSTAATNKIYKVNIGGAFTELPVLAQHAGYKDLVYVDISLTKPQLKGRTLWMTATNSGGTGFTNGSYRLDFAWGTNRQFKIVPGDGGIDTTNGTFTQTYIIATNVFVNLSSNVGVSLTFTSPTTGTFTATNQTDGVQSGAFLLGKSPLDFNGDAMGDILTQNSAAAITLWEMDGTNFLTSLPIRKTKPPTGWRVCGTGDFDGDGKPDILLQQTATSTLSVWIMHGTNQFRAVTLRNGTAPGLTWKAITAGDFNGDGKPDILLQSAARTLLVWLMNGTNFSSQVSLRSGTPANVGWQSVGTGDFNGDGRTDIVFRHTDGRVALWEFSGTTFLKSVMLKSNGPAISTGWKAVGVGDINKDGLQDIILQRTDGSLMGWLFNGTEFQRSLPLKKVASTIVAFE